MLYDWQWELFAKVMGALTPYAWPMVTLVALWLFREDIRKLAARVEEGFGVKLAPAAVELAKVNIPEMVRAGMQSRQNLPPQVESRVAADISDDFKVEIRGHVQRGPDQTIRPTGIPSAAAVGVPTVTQGPPPTNIPAPTSPTEGKDAPEVAIALMAAEFEMQLARVAASYGLEGDSEMLLARLAAKKLLPDAMARGAYLLLQARSQLAHGQKVPKHEFARIKEIAQVLIDYLRQFGVN